MRSRNARSLVTLALVAVVAACGTPVPSGTAATLAPSTGAPDPSAAPITLPPAPSFDPDPWADPAEVELAAARDGLDVRLAVSRAELVAGRPLGIRIRVANRGADSAFYFASDCQVVSAMEVSGPRPVRPGGLAWPGDAGVLKTITLGDAGPFGDVLSADQWEQGNLEGGCDAMGVMSELGSGAELELFAVWPTVTLFGEPVAEGDYLVALPFPFAGRGRPSADPVAPIEVEVPIVIRPSPAAPIVAPARALDAVLADPEFRGWLNGLPRDRWDGTDLAYERGAWRFTLRFDAGGGAAQLTVDGLNGTVTERDLPPT